MSFEIFEKSHYVALGDAIDLSHHLSTLARNRVQSPLKGLQRYYGKPGILSLAGGKPLSKCPVRQYTHRPAVPQVYRILHIFPLTK